MCGVVALLDPTGSRLGTIRDGVSALAHRGPDGHGIWHSGPVALGHTRLALHGGDAGAQPLVGDFGTGVVNGELYNHAELRLRLKKPPQQGSDSHVLLAWLAQEGLAGVAAMRGAFAAVLWDGRQLLAVRDRFGIKPLYWTWDQGLLRVASEPQALLSMGHRASWSASAIEALFTHQYLLPTQTVFGGVQALEPGAWLRARAGEPPQTGHWYRWIGESSSSPPDAEETRAQLARAVAERCLADQPVACQLSGGIDSAMVAALAARQGVRAAYTVRFVGDSGWDEAEPAKALAAHLGLEHRVLSLDQDTLLDHFDEAVVSSGGPVINTHTPAKWLLCQQVRRDGHSVLLTGEGADELFWGYEHLIADHAAAEGLEARRASPAVTGVHLPLGRALDTQLVQQTWGHTPSFLRAKASLGFRLRAVSSLSPHGNFGPLLQALGTPPEGHPATGSAWAWSRLCLSGSILQRLCDPLEMAAGVEGRLPFLDPGVAALAARIPPSERVQAGQGKVLLREAARPLLPPGASDRAKHPFMGPPLALTAHLLARLLDGPQLPFIDRSRLEDQLTVQRSRSTPERVPWDPVWLTVLSCQALAQAHQL